MEKREQIFTTFNCSTTQTKMFITLIMGKTMTDNKDKPLEKHTKREILEQICNAKGWNIKSDLATSLNRSSKLVLIEWHKDLI